jgi:hypothetical protein
MNTVLLTGAGFSHNWGGRLAREINTAVARRLEHDRDLAELLRRNPNFEDALSELQSECPAPGRSDAQERLQKLETAIAKVFDQMNSDLAKAQFSFTSDLEFAIPEFLVRFDAIFTLNQDLLLEAQYLHPSARFLTLAARQWPGGGDLPGMEVILSDVGASGPFEPLSIQYRPKTDKDWTIDPQRQPYFKLHGSTNWRDTDGGRLLIMGGKKFSTMSRYPVLSWYASKFVEYLSRANARLMVIGYGFRDDHINQLIVDAWNNGGQTLSMYIVHPDGRDILKKVNPSSARPIYVPKPLEEITVYDSTRRLKDTFGGSDPGEHRLLIQYADGH